MPFYLYLSKNPEFSENPYIAVAYNKSGIDVFYHDVALDMRDDEPLLPKKGKRRFTQITSCPTELIQNFSIENSAARAQQLMNVRATEANITIYFIQIEGTYIPAEITENTDLRKYISKKINLDHSYYTEKIFDTIHGITDFFKEKPKL